MKERATESFKEYFKHTQEQQNALMAQKRTAAAGISNSQKPFFAALSAEGPNSASKRDRVGSNHLPEPITDKSNLSS